MNRYKFGRLAPSGILLMAASVVMAESPQTVTLSRPVQLEESAMDTVTAGEGMISINSFFSGTGSSTSQMNLNSSTATSGGGVSVISKTTPDGKNTDVTLTYTIQDKNGNPQTVTEHKIIPGTNSGISVVQVPGKKPVIKIGAGAVFSPLHHKLPRSGLLRKSIVHKLPLFTWYNRAAFKAAVLSK